MGVDEERDNSPQGCLKKTIYGSLLLHKFTHTRGGGVSFP